MIVINGTKAFVGNAGTYGYRDIKVNVWIPGSDNDHVGHIGEIQFHLKDFYDLKQSKGHKLYSWIRRFDVYGMTSPDVLLLYTADIAEATIALCHSNINALFGQNLESNAVDVGLEMAILHSSIQNPLALRIQNGQQFYHHVVDEDDEEVSFADRFQEYSSFNRISSLMSESLGRELEFFCAFKKYQFEDFLQPCENRRVTEPRKKNGNVR